MNVLPIVRASLVCLCLGGCAFAGVGGSAPPATFNLAAPDMNGGSAARWPVQLTVYRPTAMRAIDTDRIVVMAPGGRLSYFEDAAWSDRLTSLVQARLVEAMQDAKSFRAVLTSDDRLDGDYALSLEIREFQVEVNNGHTAAVVTLFAKLAHEQRGKVVATREFSARIPVSSDDPGNGVAALQTGFNDVAREMVGWLASAPKGRSGA